VRSVIDNIARRIVAWRELSRDEPELAVWLDTLAEQVRTLQTRALEDATALTSLRRNARPRDGGALMEGYALSSSAASTLALTVAPGR
jgi:hypothetical protein